MRSEIVADVMADFRQFVLIEPDGLATLSPLSHARTADDIALAGAGGVMFFLRRSATEASRDAAAVGGRTRAAIVPMAPDVTLGCLTAAPSDVVVDLQVAGPFGVRVHWKAGERVAPEEDWLVEHWLIQVWAPHGSRNN